MITRTVEFTKENGEWRISGGSFFEENIASETAPQTGDAAPMLIVLAAASACTAVIFRRRIRAK